MTAIFELRHCDTELGAVVNFAPQEFNLNRHFSPINWAGEHFWRSPSANSEPLFKWAYSQFCYPSPFQSSRAYAASAVCARWPVVLRNRKYILNGVPMSSVCVFTLYVCVNVWALKPVSAVTASQWWSETPWGRVSGFVIVSFEAMSLIGIGAQSNKAMQLNGFP